MLRSLDTFEYCGVVFKYVIYSLSPTKTPVDDPWFRERLDQFTPEQISVIASFLDCVLDDDEFYYYYADAKRGLRKFWHLT